MATFGSPTARTISTWATGATFPKGRTQFTDTRGTIIVPPGALDHWYTFRADSKNRRGEIIGFGDSTMDGAGPSPLYAWLQRLRDRAVGAGLTDGGKGIINVFESSFGYDAPEINGLVTNNWLGTTDANDLFGGAMYFDDGTVTNRTLTMQFRASTARLWYMARDGNGDFSYTVDGGAATTVHAQTGGQVPRFEYISGLNPTATHTVVVTNLAGRDPLPPVSITAGATGTGGTITPGTYFYVVTYVFGGGETLPSPAASATVSAGQKVLVTAPQIGQGSIVLYRGTSSGGPFQLVSSAVYGTQAGNPVATDPGGTLGANAPTSGTTNRNLSATGATACLAGMNDVGYTTQKHAVTGQLVGRIADTEWKYWAPFGLTAPSGDATLASAYTVDAAMPSAGRPKPVLVVMELGFNDLTSDPTGSPAKAINAIQRIGACCRAAGCDGLILSGQLPYNANWPTNGTALYNAFKSEALNQGLAWADFFYPINNITSAAWAGGTNSPHLPKPSYVAQADWLWDNLLGVS